MATISNNLASPQEEPVLRDCIATLRRVADYRLPLALDKRLLWLSENKERLEITEREELTAFVELADQRSLDKVQAMALLRKLAKLYPALTGSGA